MFRPVEETPPELSDLPTERLEHEIVQVAGQLAATTCHWLLLIAEYQRREAYRDWGFPSCAGWLAWQCSLDPRSAREHVRVGQRLAELPLVRECFGRGELSYSKVRAITRVANAETEADLVELARETTASQLDRVVRDYGRRVSAGAAFDAHEARSFTHHWDENGCLQVSGCLAPEQGAAFLRALEAAEAFEDDSAAEPQARKADAFACLAESFLAHGPKRRSPGERHEVVVHVDADVLAEDEPGQCGFEAGPAIAAETARRLSCDSSLVAMLEGSRGPIRVGRKRRTIPASTRRALTARDGACRFPGCENRRFVEGHHIRHWARGGETSLENLVVLCTHHHRLIHEGGFTVDGTANGDLRFCRPNGRPVRALRRRPTGELAARGVTAGGVRPLSRGEPLDREHAAWALSSRLTADTG